MTEAAKKITKEEIEEEFDDWLEHHSSSRMISADAVG